ncbi:MAG TPA: hypothetical protein DCL60_13090, partial [Armatimonadetes bacterium]|nr:hypothetical protein [Armatimonadota bacterium]
STTTELTWPSALCGPATIALPRVVPFWLKSGTVEVGEVLHIIPSSCCVPATACKEGVIATLVFVAQRSARAIEVVPKAQADIASTVAIGMLRAIITTDLPDRPTRNSFALMPAANALFNLSRIICARCIGESPPAEDAIRIASLPFIRTSAEAGYPAATIGPGCTVARNVVAVCIFWSACPFCATEIPADVNTRQAANTIFRILISLLTSYTETLAQFRIFPGVNNNKQKIALFNCI